MLESEILGRTHLVIHYKDGKEHARMFGYFIRETEDAITVTGTIGNWTDKQIVIPKSNIIFIEVNEEDPNFD